MDRDPCRRWTWKSAGEFIDIVVIVDKLNAVKKVWLKIKIGSGRRLTFFANGGVAK